MQIPVTTSGRIHPYHPKMRPRLFHRVCGSRRCPITPILLVAAFNAAAQNAEILTNKGEPLRPAYACAEEDLQWAGMSCNEDEPCAIYLEINSIVPNGRKIFLAGNLHSNSATLSSVLLVSDDAGATWKEPAPRVRGAALELTQFYDLQHGWAAGETQYPLARDPFFLITTDGGASWRQRPVGEEGLSGAVLQFWFDSAQHGELIVDGGKTSASGRYLSYESQTGGESWTIRSKSDTVPKLLRAPPKAENPDWRIRPSKDGKSVQIEQLENGQWKPLASFLIEIASCRIQSGQLKEPEDAAPAGDAAADPAVPKTPGPKPARKKK
jgi:hypothetical protein